MASACSARALEPHFLKRGWLADAPEPVRARILAAARPLEIRRGQRLYSAGDGPGGIYGLAWGGMGVEVSTRWHLPKLGHVCREGDWFGYGPILTGSGRSVGFRAMDDSVLLSFPLAALRTEMNSSPELARLVNVLADFSTIWGSWAACDLLIPEAPRRIAAVLLRVTGALQGVEPPPGRGFHLSQMEVGEMANASRHHVNRVLGGFADRGWIAKRYGQIRIADVAAMSAFALGEE